MKIGYACNCLYDDTTKMKTCIMKNATEERLTQLIAHNLDALLCILKYNEQQGIKMFRISSDIIPFGSSPVNTLKWTILFAPKFYEIGAYIREHQMRVSFHPGQYTILNSPNQDVVYRAILDLQYHCAFLDALQLDATHKVILHVGGIYGNKTDAKARFCNVYRILDDAIKQRLVIENDDRSYHIEDVLEISDLMHIPVVFDNLHHQILQPPTQLSQMLWLSLVRRTWHCFDGNQKMHYSEQDAMRQVGAHAQSINIKEFILFVKAINRKNIDLMLEVKDKNKSAIACLEALKNANISLD